MQSRKKCQKRRSKNSFCYLLEERVKAQVAIPAICSSTPWLSPALFLCLRFCLGNFEYQLICWHGHMKFGRGNGSLPRGTAEGIYFQISRSSKNWACFSLFGSFFFCIRINLLVFSIGPGPSHLSLISDPVRNPITGHYARKPLISFLLINIYYYCYADENSLHCDLLWKIKTNEM